MCKCFKERQLVVVLVGGVVGVGEWAMVVVVGGGERTH